MTEENTNQNTEEKESNKGLPNLELKIENMLDKLIDIEEENEDVNQNDGESLKFSEEMSEEDKFPEDDELFKNFFFNPPSQSEDHDFPKINESKLDTNINYPQPQNLNYIQYFPNNNNFNNNNNNNNIFYNNNINNTPSFNNFLNQPPQNKLFFQNRKSAQFVNFNFNSILNSSTSSNFRTYMNTNSNSHNDSNINYERSLVFNDNSSSLAGSDFFDSNNSFNLSNRKNSKFFFRRNQKYHNTCYPYSIGNKMFNFNPNEILANNNNNGNFYNKLCNNNNVVSPIGGNVEIEMILMDVNKILTKIEKIDQMIYNKLQGKFEQIIRTHKGSRIFQYYLKNTHNDILHQIFLELKNKLPELLRDNYANYFCKKFFDCLSQKDRIEYLTAIQNDLSNLAIDNTATYPIQGILEELGSKNEKKIIYMGLKDSINNFCYNIYGTHVLEKILSYFEDEFIQEIIEFVYHNFINLAYHINGICIVKKLLLMTHKKDLHQKLKKIVFENALNLIVHPYGNYVIQVIVENWDDNELVDILGKYKGKYVTLSMQKYSSNVLERIIEKNDKNLELYINEICTEKNLCEIMKNNYGNYVIQKAIKLSNGKNYERLFKEINQNMHKLDDKKITKKWQIILSTCAKN